MSPRFPVQADTPPKGRAGNVAEPGGRGECIFTLSEYPR